MNISARLVRPTWTLAVMLIMPAASAETFQDILDDHWKRAVEEQVFFRGDPDAFRMNGKLAEVDAEARARRREFNETIIARLSLIDPRILDADERISYRVFQYERLTERESYSQYDHLFPITRLFGYHSYFAEAPAAMSFLESADYRNYLISLGDFPRYNREHIALLREAIALGYTHYCKSMEGYEATISAHIVEDAEESALYVPFRRFPAQIPLESRNMIRMAGKQRIESLIVPAFRELLEFFNNEYMPACRKTVGITSLQDGDRYYDYLVRYFTTTDMSPKEIHELGLAEVARIRGEMNAIIDDLQFTAGFRAFLDYLRNEPDFYARSVDELLRRAAYIAKTAEGELPRFFGTLPRGTYNIKANSGRGSFYMPSSGDGKTSGTYFVGTSNLNGQPLYTLEALTLHEGVPGHHLQTALAMELGLPEFRRTLYHSGYGEGWGLYSERLGKEMGFYEDPYSDFGRLTYE
ncbi:MAG: DUF885 family protein, partial [Gammaproteobacteria bacterium]|nr:DUF885 family protein [Gammaproteobacteria bacterium]